MTAPEPQAEFEASDLGRFEPTPYDFGISDNPDASWSDPQAEPEPEAEPSFIGGLPEDRITVTAEHEIVAADPEAGEAKSWPRDRLENLRACRDSRYRGPVAEPDPDAPVPFTLAERLEAALDAAEPEAGP